MRRNILDIENEFGRIRNQMNSLLENMFSNSHGDNMQLLEDNPKSGTSLLNNNMMRTPIVDINENDNEVIASIEVPGVNKEDIQLEVNNGMLNLKAEHKDEQKEEREGLYSYKKSYSGYARTFPIPDYIDEEKITSKYTNGVLNVHMPKKEEMRGKSKQIDVK
ncbi:MAG: Hsp20/alpha crystallin family protein [Candidatus Nanoarchaeia archaeon]